MSADLSEAAPLELPRTWQVVLSNVLVMGFCLLTLPGYVAWFWHWDPCMHVTAVLVGAPTLWFGVLAWRSLVRRHASSAELVAAFCFAGAMLLCLVALIILGQFAVNHRRSLADLGAGLGVIALAAVPVWCSLVNRQWAAALRGPAKPYDPVANYHARTAGWSWPSPRFTLQEVLLAMAALAWVFGAARWHVLAFPPQYAEHVGREDSPITLPPDATDVNYSQTSHAKQVDFICSEATFLEWLEGHKSSSGKLERRGGEWNYFALYGPDSYLGISYDTDTGRCHFRSASR